MKFKNKSQTISDLQKEAAVELMLSSYSLNWESLHLTHCKQKLN